MRLRFYYRTQVLLCTEAALTHLVLVRLVDLQVLVTVRGRPTTNGAHEVMTADELQPWTEHELWSVRESDCEGTPDDQWSSRGDDC